MIHPFPIIDLGELYHISFVKVNGVLIFASHTAHLIPQSNPSSLLLREMALDEAVEGGKAV